MQSEKQGNKQNRRCSRLFSYYCSIFKSQPVTGPKNLTARLNDMVDRKHRLGLAIIPRQRVIRDPSGPVWQRVIMHPSGPVSAERKLYGREAEKETIMTFLRDEKDVMDVLPIVGAGGIGKTTLLQYIYNDNEVIRWFQLRAWVFVSQEWNMCDIFKIIIENITQQPCLIQSLQNLKSKVSDELKNKKFCIVLDDIWSLDILQWKELCVPLKVGAPGSKVLVTTRKIKVANRVMTVDAPIHLSSLSKDDWFELFCSYVGFDIQSLNSKLVEVGENIAQKCGGLPLAAAVIGSHLRGNHNEEDWSAMLNDNSSNQIDSVLKMSYNNLPYELKRCFLYCSIFPEDYQFREDDLVELWIAAGLVKSDNISGGRTNAEIVGHSYFMELVSRSLLTSFGNCYKMHDLIRDMGRNISNDRYCRWENKLGSWKKSRYLSINKSMTDRLIKDLGQRKGETSPLRTLMIIGGQCSSIEEIDDNLFSKLPRLRAFLAKELPIQKLSKMICQMKYLIYLNLSSCTKLTELPMELGNLGTLWKLNLRGCNGLTKLPTTLGNLGNLQELNLTGCMKLTDLPSELGNVSNLQRLHLDWCTGLTSLLSELGSLGNLQQLHLKWCSGLTWLPLELGNLSSLQQLHLEWCSNLTLLPVELGNLSSLQLLNLKGCSGLTSLPREFGYLHMLQYLDIGFCTKLVGLPWELGNLSNLQYLGLERCTGLDSLPRELGNLETLQYLDLNQCSGLTSLPLEFGYLSSLQYLRVEGCVGLSSLPPELQNLGSMGNGPARNTWPWPSGREKGWQYQEM